MTVAMAASVGSLVSTALGWLTPLAIAAPALILAALLLTAGKVKVKKSAKMQE